MDIGVDSDLLVKANIEHGNENIYHDSARVVRKVLSDYPWISSLGSWSMDNDFDFGYRLTMIDMDVFVERFLNEKPFYQAVKRIEPELINLAHLESDLISSDWPLEEQARHYYISILDADDMIVCNDSDLAERNLSFMPVSREMGDDDELIDISDKSVIDLENEAAFCQVRSESLSEIIEVLINSGDEASMDLADKLLAQSFHRSDTANQLRKEIEEKRSSKEREVEFETALGR